MLTLLKALCGIAGALVFGGIVGAMAWDTNEFEAPAYWPVQAGVILAASILGLLVGVGIVTESANCANEPPQKEEETTDD